MKLTSDERVQYGREVWDTFSKRFRIGRDMTCAEYNLLAKWMDRGIPLAIILRGIEETGGKPRTLHACEYAVDRAIAYWHQSVGSLTQLPDPWPL